MATAPTQLEPPFKFGQLPGATTLPLVVEPGSGIRSLSEALGSNPGWARQKVYDHGAILFRGFPVRTPEEFEAVARTIAPDLQNRYLGTSPRNALTSYVFTASELPPWYPVPQHIEMSFTRTPPSFLFFHCMRASRGEGGETPLVDFRRVLRDLEPAVRTRFETLGVRNIRNYDGPDVKAKASLWQLKRWDEMFGTTDRTAVERESRDQGFDVEWLPGGRLRLTNRQPATKAHPVTGEQVWFNHSQVFHLSAAEGEMKRVSSRQRFLQSRGLSVVAKALAGLQRGTQSSQEHAMHCTYGDGSEIPDSDMEAVRNAIWKNLVAFRWQEGDVVAIDNSAVSHGRFPYRGPRLITVCWA